MTIKTKRSQKKPAEACREERMRPFIEEDSVLLCGDDLIQNGSWTEKGLALIAAIEVGAITDKKGVYDTATFDKFWDKFEDLRLENGKEK